MELDIGTILEHSAVAGILFGIIQFVLVPMINRLMNRLDVVTDKLIEIAESQKQIINQQASIVSQISPRSDPKER